MNVPGFMLPLYAFMKLYKDQLKTNKGKKILFEMGYLQGQSAGERFFKRVDGNFPKFVQLSQEIWQVVGLGKFKVTQVSNRLLFNLSPSPLAEEYKKKYGKSKDPICIYALGILSGYFEKYYNQKLNGFERLCVAKGDSHCEINFSLTKASKKK